MYRYYVTKRSPVSAWILDDAAPFAECSGNGQAATMDKGTPTKSVPLVSGAQYSSVFSRNNVAKFPCNLFKQGSEDRPFALEAWVLPVVTPNARVNMYPDPEMNNESGGFLNKTSSLTQRAGAGVGGSNAGVLYYPGDNWKSNYFDIVELEENSTAYFSAKVKNGYGPRTFTIRFEAYNSETGLRVDQTNQFGDAVSWIDSQMFTPTSAYETYSHSGVLPPGADQAHFSIHLFPQVSDPGELLIDQVYISSIDGEYFGGDTPGAFWMGATNNSPSGTGYPASEQKILSHADSYDGLTVNGNVIRFGTEYLSTGEAYCNYELQVNKLAHVVGIHNSQRNELWVNGEIVSSVDITDEQRADAYLSTGSDLYCGDSIFYQKVVVNGVAFYNTITGEDIKRNYRAGIDFIGQDGVYPQFGGIAFNLNSASGSVFLEDEWTSRSDFEEGMRQDVDYTTHRIVQAYSEGVSLPGSWTISVPLDASDSASIYGAMVSWVGSGVSVESSVDGTTWAPVEDGSLVTSIPTGYDPTGKDLQVRVNFAGGLAEDPAYLESLTIRGYEDNLVESTSIRQVNVTHPAVLHKNYEPNLYRDDNGVYLDGGSVTIGADSSLDPLPVRTLELWIKPISGAPTISVDGTKYRNGAPDSTMPVGEWSLVHITSATDIAGSITVSGDAIVGQATLYPSELSATDVASLWSSYIGRTFVRFSDVETIGLSEGVAPTKIYAHDWAIDSAG